MFIDYRYEVNGMETKRIAFATKGHRLKYIVNASNTVHVFIVDDKAWKKYSRGEQFNWKNKEYYGASIEEELYLPFSGKWNLLIVNGSNEKIGFNFEVYSL